MDEGGPPTDEEKDALMADLARASDDLSKRRKDGGVEPPPRVIGTPPNSIDGVLSDLRDEQNRQK